MCERRGVPIGSNAHRRTESVRSVGHSVLRPAQLLLLLHIVHRSSGSGTRGCIPHAGSSSSPAPRAPCRAEECRRRRRRCAAHRSTPPTATPPAGRLRSLPRRQQQCLNEEQQVLRCGDPGARRVRVRQGCAPPPARPERPAAAAAAAACARASFSVHMLHQLISGHDVWTTEWACGVVVQGCTAHPGPQA